MTEPVGIMKTGQRLELAILSLHYSAEAVAGARNALLAEGNDKAEHDLVAAENHIAEAWTLLHSAIEKNSTEAAGKFVDGLRGHP